MSRRYQQGNVVKYGNWWIVRFRVDVPNQPARSLTYERICPVNGPGSMAVGERRRKAAQILKDKGVNSHEVFAQANNGTTFSAQAKWFMDNAATRKRNPIKAATASGWQNILDKWLDPNLGEMPLASINNGTLKALVSKMSEAGLSAKTIISYAQLVKLVVASAVDDKTGEPLFPVKWNHDFIDMPVVGKQHQPTFTADEMTKIAKSGNVLFTLLAATGLRAGEALGLEIKNISDDFTTLSIEQSAWEGDIQSPRPTTQSAL